jgi:hypothetical protein
LIFVFFKIQERFIRELKFRVFIQFDATFTKTPEAIFGEKDVQPIPANSIPSCSIQGEGTTIVVATTVEEDAPLEQAKGETITYHHPNRLTPSKQNPSMMHEGKTYSLGTTSKQEN